MRLLLLATMLLPIVCFSQLYDSLGMVRWECKAKRISRTEMKIKIVGYVRKGFFIGPLEGTVGKDEISTIRPTIIMFNADSNWYVNADPVIDGAMIGRSNKAHTSKYYWNVKNVDTIREAVPTYVKVGGKKKRAATFDSTGLNPVYDYIPKPQVSYVSHVTAKVHGRIRIKRTLTLSRSSLQQSVAQSLFLPSPITYIEGKKDRKKRMKVNNRNEKNYKSRYPISIDVTLIYETAYQRMYEFSIPFRGIPLGKWRTVHNSSHYQKKLASNQ